MSSPAPLPSADDPIRERLIASAAEVFAEKGYDRAGVAEIARRAGYTTGAIYGRFTGKAELLLAAIEAHSDNELDTLFNEHRFQGKVTDILTTVGSHLVTDSLDAGGALLLEAFVAARRDPEVRRLVQGVLDLRRDRLADLVVAAKATGAIDPELDTEAIVRFCHAVGFGFLLFRAVDIDLPAAEPWEELIARLVDALDVSGPDNPPTSTSTTG
ncbi:MAG TPA: TetR/AcrR family transcriptional regulator [Acidimicrobiales bacterium]